LVLEAGQAVNYAEAHDNMTLFDKLWAVNSQTSRIAVAKQSRQISSLLFLAQGTPFIQAGQEFLRTKGGDPNSYISPDSVNSIKWGERAKEATTVAYNKGLIAIRKAHPAFRQSSPTIIAKIVKFLSAPSDVLAYSIDGKAVKDSWGTIVVASNPNASAKKVVLPAKATWLVKVMNDKAGVATLQTLKNTNFVMVPANSTILLHK
jgi:pullulanase